MPSSSLLGIWGDKQWLEWLNEERAHINRISLMGADSSGSKPTVTLATILAIGVSLSLDSMAVCIAAGIQTKPKIYQVCVCSSSLGFLFSGLESWCLWVIPSPVHAVLCVSLLALIDVSFTATPPLLHVPLS